MSLYEVSRPGLIQRLQVLHGDPRLTVAAAHLDAAEALLRRHVEVHDDVGLCWGASRIDRKRDDHRRRLARRSRGGQRTTFAVRERAGARAVAGRELTFFMKLDMWLKSDMYVSKSRRSMWPDLASMRAKTESS